MAHAVFSFFLEHEDHVSIIGYIQVTVYDFLDVDCNMVPDIAQRYTIFNLGYRMLRSALYRNYRISV